MLASRNLADEAIGLSLVSVPLVTPRSSIVTKASSSLKNIDLSSLEFYIGGVFVYRNRGSLIGDYLSGFQYPINEFLSYEALYGALLSDEIDYVISDYFIGKLWAHNYKASDQFVCHDIEIPNRALYLITTKNGAYSHLVDEIPQFLQTYEEGGVVDYLNGVYLKSWLSSPCNK